MKKSNKLKLTPNPKLDKVMAKITSLERERANVETNSESKLKKIDGEIDKLYTQHEKLENERDEEKEREVREALRAAVKALRYIVDEQSADAIERWMQRNGVQL